MKKNISYIFILILFVLSGIISWGLYFKEYSQSDTVDIHHFPKVIGDWESEELVITEEEYAILETRNAFTRKYTNSKGDSVYLFTIYSQNNRKVSHPPELCYTGSGATVLSKAPAQIPISQGEVIEVNQVIVEYGQAQQVLYYWFKVGDGFTPGYWKQQILIGLNTLTGKPASSALIRLSSTVQGEGEVEKAKQVIKDFSPLIMPHIQKYLP